MSENGYITPEDPYERPSPPSQHASRKAWQIYAAALERHMEAMGLLDPPIDASTSVRWMGSVVVLRFESEEMKADPGRREDAILAFRELVGRMQVAKNAAEGY